MRPLTINVQKVYNLGQYQTLRLGAEFSLDNGEDMEHAMRAAIVQLDAYFSASQAKPAQIEEKQAPAAAEPEKPQPKAEEEPKKVEKPEPKKASKPKAEKPEPKAETKKAEPKVEMSKATGQPKQDIKPYLQWIADAVNKYGGKFTANDGTIQTLTRELIDDLFYIAEADKPATEFTLSHLGLAKTTK